MGSKTLLIISNLQRNVFRIGRYGFTEFVGTDFPCW